MIRKIVLTMVLALAAGTAVAQEKLDINGANAEQLAATLDGVGEVRAQAIVDYRETNGDFPSVADQRHRHRPGHARKQPRPPDRRRDRVGEYTGGAKTPRPQPSRRSGFRPDFP